VVDVAWLLEELRVSLFAQVLGTPRPVSEQRVRRAVAALGTS
jgi:ATP-dependent helicase HrpA